MDRPKVSRFTPPKTLAALPAGPTFRAGHITETNAGMRTFRPVIDATRCVGCLRCFLVCPDGAIDKSSRIPAIDYDFCKGCGVCTYECRLKAIAMRKEAEG